MADLVESFWLYGKDGSMHRAHFYQDRTGTPGLEGPGSTTPGSTPGLRTARLQDGTDLECVDENTFKNAVTGEVLSRKEPEKRRNEGYSNGVRFRS
jgi:hypothetical protein